MRSFDHAAFQVSNMDFAIQFYTEKLGFALSSRAFNPHESEEYASLTLGDLRLELIEARGRHQAAVLPPPGDRNG